MAQAGEGPELEGTEEDESSRTDTTLESFVAKLQAEGVEAGRREADRLTAEAEAEAREILRKARVQAERLEAEAASRVEAELERGRAELRLAFRDTVLELQAALRSALEGVLAGAVEEAMRDPSFMAELVREAVTAYARSDAEGVEEVRMSPESLERLKTWASGELAALLGAEVALVNGPMADAGFEFRVRGGTVEVTVEAVTAKLLELVTPHLREVVARASDGGTVSPSAGEEPS